MDLIRASISKPVSVSVGVILVLLFGFIGIVKLPVQLTPDVENPQITVETVWPGATPDEIEKDIVEKQEDTLKSVRGLTMMESSSYNGYAEITLTFSVGTDLDNALLRVSNKLQEVSDYPDNAERPIINASGAQASPIIWMTLKADKDNPDHIYEYRTFFENNIRQYIERVPGVGSLFVFGGTEKQLEVVVDPIKLAKHDLTLSNVIDRVRSSNNDVSAGVLGVEKKNYRIRTKSQFEALNDPLNVVLYDDGFRRVFVRDVATTRFGYAANDVSVMQNADPVIVVGVRKEQGANVLQLTERVEEAVNKLNEGYLKDNGLYIEWVYDQRPYINTAIDLVLKNVMIGGVLAIVVLLLFLRSISSTITVAVSIPISAIGTFIFMWILGRNFNVVSLAGISFAVGMLVDNSIVVLENIDRHRKQGKSPFQASYEGAKEVWGAVLASTLTTVAVFLPVIFIQQEAGQLFRDIAIAITFSIILSLFVSVAVIPMMTNKLFSFTEKKLKNAKTLKMQQDKVEKDNVFVRIIMFFSRVSLSNVFTRLITVVAMTGISVVIMMLLMPKSEYLPQGNRNLILNIMIPPPGYSVDKREKIGNYIFEQTGPYFEQDDKDGIPQIRDIFYVAADRIMLFGAICVHETTARGMMPLFNRIINSIPGIFGISIQAGIFEDRIGRGRTIDINISGSDLDKILQTTRMMYGKVAAILPNAQVRPEPSLEVSYPEANIVPDRSKVIANGFTEDEIGVYVDVLMDGRKVGEFKPKGMKQIDLVVRSDDKQIYTPEQVMQSIIVNPFGNLIRVNDIATLEYTQGMTQIYHLERFRTIKLEVTPPETIPLEQAMDVIENDLIAPLRQQGALEGLDVNIGGNADKLTETRNALQWNFLLAIVITYLLMSALFENFLYPFVIMFSVPLAAAGGFIGLRLVDLFVAPQSFDVLTMLGFIILVGTVVNNAILIVHQALNYVRYEGFGPKEAILESVRTRIRPIFMSATTSVFGLFPLVISTGSGSELYRGLGSVLLGGLVLSTVLTLFVIPALLSFLIHMEKPAESHTAF